MGCSSGMVQVPTAAGVEPAVVAWAPAARVAPAEYVQEAAGVAPAVVAGAVAAGVAPTECVQEAAVLAVSPLSRI